MEELVEALVPTVDELADVIPTLQKKFKISDEDAGWTRFFQAHQGEPTRCLLYETMSSAQKALHVYIDHNPFSSHTATRPERSGKSEELEPAVRVSSRIAAS